MLNDIEAGYFFALICTHLHKGTHNFEQHEGTNDCQCISNDNGDKLCNQKVRTAIEKSVCACRIDFSGRPEARSNCAPGSADAMYAKGIKRIIITQFSFDNSNRRTQIAQAQLQQIQANLHSNERLQIDDTLTALATAAAGR